MQKACFTLHSKMNIENELSQFDELIRLEEDNLRTAVTCSKDLYGQDDIIESKFQELLDLIQEKRYVEGMKITMAVINRREIDIQGIHLHRSSNCIFKAEKNYQLLINNIFSKKILYSFQQFMPKNFFQSTLLLKY